MSEDGEEGEGAERGRKEKVTKCQLHDSNITVSYGYWTLKLKRLHQLIPRVFYNRDNRLLKTLSSLFLSLYKKIITFFYFLGVFKDGRQFCKKRIRLGHLDTKPNHFNCLQCNYRLLQHCKTLHLAHTVTVQMSGALARLQTATVTFVMSVCLSAHNRTDFR